MKSEDGDEHVWVSENLYPNLSKMSSNAIKWVDWHLLLSSNAIFYTVISHCKLYNMSRISYDIIIETCDI